MSFFRPTSRIRVSYPLGIVLNTLNVLAPALLVCAVGLIIASTVKAFAAPIRELLTIYSVALVVAALTIRIIWGICIHRIKVHHSLQPKRGGNACDDV